MNTEYRSEGQRESEILPFPVAKVHALHNFTQQNHRESECTYKLYGLTHLCEKKGRKRNAKAYNATLMVLKTCHIEGSIGRADFGDMIVL